ncbi:PWI domain-containing protein [Portunus trituberculatus]|uniref:PWI domain-containing protein n=1 Tax=Portunus trituberculatus TaxID=210409 RepID=A0A5B7GNI8_PORTR|nr:PWI domain-containing protein [Portunus trituberculatus]
MKEMKFAESLGKKIDMTKVRLEVVKPWVTEKITGILGMEDDVVIEYVFNQLEAEKGCEAHMPEHPVRKGSQGPGHQGEDHHTEGLQPGPLLGPVLSYLPGLLLASGQGAVWNPDPRKMQIMLTGFLNGKNARIFMGELWDLLLSAQASPSGIPKQFLDQKKEELKKKMEEEERLQKIQEARRERDKEKEKEKERDRDRDKDREKDRKER